MPFRIFKWMVYSGFTVMVIGVIAVVVMLYQIIPTIPQLPDDLNDIFGQTTKVYAYDQEGNSFLIFPEGTRSRTGELLPFKKGGFVMAIRGGATIVPLTIFGAHKAMRRGSPIIRPVTITVRIGEPIDAQDYGVDHRGGCNMNGMGACFKISVDVGGH